MADTLALEALARSVVDHEGIAPAALVSAPA